MGDPDSNGLTGRDAAIVDNTNERRWVKQAIKRTWEAESFVRFKGWGNCDDNDEDFFGARITLQDSAADNEPPRTFGAFGGIGTGITIPNGGVWLNFTMNNWNGCGVGQSPENNTLQDCIERVAVHEFGHVLGFAHEQDRPEGIPTDISCSAIPGTSSGATVTVGPWDVNSIMNYCSEDYANNGELSDIDKAMVKTAYGNVAIYNSAKHTICLTVVKYAGRKYSGCLERINTTQWKLMHPARSYRESKAPADFSSSKLIIPFVALYDGENVIGFYQDVVFKQDGEGLFTFESKGDNL